MSTPQAFPQYNDPFVDPSGRITRSWRYLLQSLWTRTGQNGGIISADLISGNPISYYTPPGMIVDFGGTSAPTGWLLCDGSAVSRMVYAALFSAIGTKWGTGDGTATFNLPYLIKSGAVGVNATTIVYTNTIKIIKT